MLNQKSKIINHKSESGFTLLEVIVYLALFAIVSSGVVLLTLNAYYSRAKAVSIDEVSQNSRLVMGQIAQAIRNASSITSPATSTTSTLIRLQMPNSTRNPTYFDLSSGAVVTKVGSNATSTLTSHKVKVNDFFFHNISYAKTPGAARLQMTIQYASSTLGREYQYERTYYATETIRKRQ
jgi:prepilin-type N-terminal cleavage/methylation domain-containing protein